MRISLTIMSMIICVHCSLGQFQGGSADGYDTNLMENSTNIYLGGNQDGYNTANFVNPISIFKGGNEDGYVAADFSNPISIYKGGEMDGYHLAGFTNPINIFSGAEGDGFDAVDFENTINIFAGGEKDGYARANKFLSFIWTGAVGTGWNVADNWMDGLIPDINSRVVIPANAVNFPAINAGLMSIGQDPNEGDYLCKQILIRKNAEMTFRVNAFLENYGDLEIRGRVFILNSALTALQNLNGAKILIRSGGSLDIQP
jgi:hypothetical protein